MRIARAAQTVFWWVATLAVLVVLDDLTFGPAFWLISRTLGPGIAVLAIFASYVPAQLYLVYQGSKGSPGRVSAWWLKRLDLERRSIHVRRNEAAVRRQVTGSVSALLLSPVIGGVLPPLILQRKGTPQAVVRGIAWPAAIIYAATFALLHGMLPATF